MPKMANKKTVAEKRKTRRLWWLSGLFVLALALLLTKLTLNLGHLFLNHEHIQSQWVSPLEVWAKNGEDKAPSPAPAMNAGNDSSMTVVNLAQNSASGMGEMLAHLQKREAKLDKKEEELRRKEEYLKQMQEETEQKLQQLITVQQEIQAYREEKQTAENGKLKSLIKIYENMKPKGAAKLLESLDEALVVKIVSQMNTSLAATILANMDPAKAVKISQALTKP